MPRAIDSMSVIDCGVRITSVWSMFGSASTASKRRGVAVGPGVADHVDRILQVGRGGQRAAHLLHRFGGQPRDRQPAADRRVGGHHARPAGVGDDRQAVAGRQGLIGVEDGRVEHLLDAVDADDARLAEHGVADGVLAGQRAGVAGGGVGPLRRAARLDRQDRLGVGAAGDAAGRLDQSPPVAQLLQVQQNHVGLRIVVQVVEQFDLRHARLVAETDELREADLLFAGVVEHRRAERPTG